MTLEDEGFFSLEVDALATEALRDFAPDRVAIVRRANRFAIAVSRQAREIPDQDRDTYLLAGTLLGRAIQDFEGAVTLASRGFRAQSRALVRATLETAMYCTAASRDQVLTKGAALKAKKDTASTTRFAEAIEGGHTRFRAKMAAELQAVPDLPPELAAMLAKLQREIGGQHQDVDLCGLAQDLGLSDLYTVIYRPLSQEVHPRATSLEHHVELSEAGKIRGMRIGPDFTQFADTLTLAVCSLLVAVDGFLQRFGNDDERLELQSLAEAYCALKEELGGDS
jgi:hypothetical protein